MAGDGDSMWQAIVKTALLGTERGAGLPDGEGRLGELLRQSKEHRHGDAEAAFLDAVAATTAQRAVGCGAERLESASLPAPCADDPRVVVGARATMHLESILTGDERSSTLAVEWVELVRAAGKRAAVASLPSLLDRALRHKKERDAILDIVGPRGHWLAAQDERWSALPVRTVSSVEGVSVDDSATATRSVWDEGTVADRIAYLRSERERDPRAARELLLEVWSQERARERTALLQALDRGLSMDDEPFLEERLDDRSQGVKRAAAGLLGRLASSRLAARRRDRLVDRLRWHSPGGVAKLVGRRATLEVALPDDLDDSMRRDGIEEKPPKGLGKKAWWLRQQVSVVDPSFWTEHWKTTPAEVLRAAVATDWHEVLWDGWADACCRFRAIEWAEAFIEAGRSDAEILRVLPPERRDAVLTRGLARVSPQEAEELLGTWAQDDLLSDSVHDAVLGLIERITGQKTVRNYRVYETFRALARVLRVPLPPRAVLLLGRHLLEDTAWSTIVRELLDTLRFRRQMRDAILCDDASRSTEDSDGEEEEGNEQETRDR